MDPDWLRADLAAIYPQFGLRLAHEGLVLLAPTDAELLELTEAVGEPGGILGPGREDWTDWEPGRGAASVRAFLRHFWDLRTAPGPAGWVAPFAVVADGRVVGVADLRAPRWYDGREVASGSWLVRPEQGRGLGTRVRLMLLELAFAHLGAARAVSGASEADVGSRRVSARCGYREIDRGPGPGGRGTVLRLAVGPAAWRRRRLEGVEVDGVEEFRAAITGPA